MKFRKACLILLACLAAGPMALRAAPPDPADPELLEIAFTFVTHPKGGDFDLHAIYADGSHETALLEGGFHQYPSWSRRDVLLDPAGQAPKDWIAVYSVSGPTSRSIQALKPDGTGLCRVDDLGGGTWGLAWSTKDFGGRYWIAHTEEQGGACDHPTDCMDLYLVEFDPAGAGGECGSEPQCLTCGQGDWENFPEWSWDGRYLLYRVGLEYESSSYVLIVEVSFDGLDFSLDNPLNLSGLLSGSAAAQSCGTNLGRPNWSKEDHSIAFICDGTLWILPDLSAGSGPLQWADPEPVVSANGGIVEPLGTLSWSPQGEIAFEGRTLPYNLNTESSLYAVDPDDPGGTLRLLAGGRKDRNWPDWRWGAPCVSASDCDDANECTVDSCGVGAVCAHDPVADGVPCGDGGSGSCQGGVCVTPECIEDSDCTDDDSCSVDTCSGAGTPTAYCEHDYPACGLGDGCCGPGCDSSDPDCCTHSKEKGPRCSDGLDNDCDGAIDRDDPDCR